MKLKILLIILLSSYFFSGCKTVHQPKAQFETQEEMESALSSIAGAVMGQPVSEEELNNLSRQLRSDPETRTAVESITNNLTMPPASIKYCPKDGKRFASNLTLCPEHNVPLEQLEE